MLNKVKCWIIYLPKDSFLPNTVLYKMKKLRHRDIIRPPKSHNWELEKLGLGLRSLSVALLFPLGPSVVGTDHTFTHPTSLAALLLGGINKTTAENKTCFPFVRLFLSGCTPHMKMFAQTTLKHRQRHEVETYIQIAWCGLFCFLILLASIKKNKTVNYLPEIIECLQ